MYCYFRRSQSPAPTIVLLCALTSLDAFFRNQKGFATLLPIETHFDSGDFLRSSLATSDLNKGHFLDSLGDFQSFGNQLCPRRPAVSRFRRHHFRRHGAFWRRGQNHFRSGNFHCPSDAFNHFPVRFFQATNITQLDDCPVPFLDNSRCNFELLDLAKGDNVDLQSAVSRIEFHNLKKVKIVISSEQCMKDHLKRGYL